MDTNQNEKLLKEVKSLCPYDISILPMKRRKQLLVIKFPSKKTDFDGWVINDVQNLHWDKIFPLIAENREALGRTRCLYCCDDWFVLYNPTGKAVLNKTDLPIDYVCVGDYEMQKYIGTCAPVELLIAYLTEKTPLGI